MSKLRSIIRGHINELRAITGTENREDEKIFQIRAQICESCPLKQGNSCNKRAYMKPSTLEVATVPTEGYIKGCGCRLSAKQRSKVERCPAGFWGNEF